MDKFYKVLQALLLAIYTEILATGSQPLIDMGGGNQNSSLEKLRTWLRDGKWIFLYFID